MPLDERRASRRRPAAPVVEAVDQVADVLPGRARPDPNRGRELVHHPGVAGAHVEAGGGHALRATTPAWYQELPVS